MREREGDTEREKERDSEGGRQGGGESERERGREREGRRERGGGRAETITCFTSVISRIFHYLSPSFSFLLSLSRLLFPSFSLAHSFSGQAERRAPLCLSLTLSLAPSL